jgi:hypothetical protein
MPSTFGRLIVEVAVRLTEPATVHPRKGKMTA